MLSFFPGNSNQWNLLTRLVHLYCFFDRHPYWQYPKPYSHMAIWPYSHIAILFQIWPIWVLSKKQCKCSNLVKTFHWIVFPVKNESKIALMEYFPLYYFRFSIIKLKLMAKLEFLTSRSTFWFLWMLTCIHSTNWSALNIFKNMCKEQHPNTHDWVGVEIYWEKSSGLGRSLNFWSSSEGQKSFWVGFAQ